MMASSCGCVFST